MNESQLSSQGQEALAFWATLQAQQALAAQQAFAARTRRFAEQAAGLAPVSTPPPSSAPALVRRFQEQTAEGPPAPGRPEASSQLSSLGRETLSRWANAGRARAEASARALAARTGQSQPEETPSGNESPIASTSFVPGEPESGPQLSSLGQSALAQWATAGQQRAEASQRALAERMERIARRGREPLITPPAAVSPALAGVDGPDARNLASAAPAETPQAPQEVQPPDVPVSTGRPLLDYTDPALLERSRLAIEADKQRKAQQEQEARIQEAQRQQQQEEASRRYRQQQEDYAGLQTPLSRMAYQERLHAAAQEHTGGLEQEANRVGVEQRYRESGAGRGEQEKQTQLATSIDALKKTMELEREAVLAQTRATQATTVEGQAQFRRQELAQRHIEEAHQREQRARRIAEEGGFNVALGQAREFLGGATRLAGRGLAVGQNFLGRAHALGSTASPNTGATLDVSLQILQAQIGREFVPLQIEGARLAQGAARVIGQAQESFPRLTRAATYAITAAASASRFGPWAAAGAAVAAGTVGLVTAPGEPIPGAQPLRRFAEGATNQAGPAIQRAAEEALRQQGMDPARARQQIQGGQGAEARNELMRSYRGLPPSRSLSGTEYYESIQGAALNQGPADSHLLQQQLQTLEHLGGVLQTIADNTSGLHQANHPWGF